MAHTLLCRALRSDSPRFYGKYRVSQPEDSLEQEADRVADQVLRMPEPVHRTCAACRAGAGPCPVCGGGQGSTASDAAGTGLQRQPIEEEEEALQLKAGSGATADSASVSSSTAVEAIQSGGAPLPAPVRGYFEPRFGTDLGGVRLHTGEAAARATSAVNARAFTLGSDIVFAPGEFNPGSVGGQRLLAHELTHVVQQTRGEKGRESIQRQAEQEAPVEHRIGQPLCEGRIDITEKFRRFVSDLPGLINGTTDLNESLRRRLLRMVRVIFSREGRADLMRFSAVCCRQINTSLARGGESTSAYVDEAAREVGMTHRVAGLMDTYRADPSDTDTLIEFLQVMAHEKRHVTLGSVAAVDPANLRPSVSASAADHASYRIEEILSIAEEIAVAADVLREDYVVPRAEQERLYRSRNMLRGWVTAAEFERIRGVIIAQLRNRYGFTGGCDNSVVAGIVHSMDTGNWFDCNRRTGEIIGGARPGLRVCETGPNAFCRARP